MMNVLKKVSRMTEKYSGIMILGFISAVAAITVIFAAALIFIGNVEKAIDFSVNVLLFISGVALIYSTVALYMSTNMKNETKFRDKLKMIEEKEFAEATAEVEKSGTNILAQPHKLEELKKSVSARIKQKYAIKTEMKMFIVSLCFIIVTLAYDYFTINLR